MFRSQEGTTLLTRQISADASLTKDGRILAVSNMLNGFELFAMKGFVELEPLFPFQQDVHNGPPIPVLFAHGGHAIVGGTLHGPVNVWDIYSRRKQTLELDGNCLSSWRRTVWVLMFCHRRALRASYRSKPFRIFAPTNSVI